MSSPIPRPLFPRRPLEPQRELLRRVGIAVGVLLLVALITWLGRDGYRDADGNGLSVLDAIYHASVTVTTTGYGDITPVTPAARAVTAFVVTPLRVVFLVVLVGTTLALLTERYREVRAESRWRKRVTGHIIVAGYGTRGRGAIDTIIATGSATPDHVVAIDISGAALDDARRAGLTTILGDATRTAVLRHARVGEARALIVTCHGDDTATLVTLTARELNPQIVIAAAVREVENAHCSPAPAQRPSSCPPRPPGGSSVSRPTNLAPSPCWKICSSPGRGLELIERPVRDDEVGGAPRVRDGLLPIALVRGSERIPFEAPGFHQTRSGDVVVCVGSPRHRG